MTPIDWFDPHWGRPGTNVHVATGGGMDAEGADDE